MANAGKPFGSLQGSRNRPCRRQHKAQREATDEHHCPFLSLPSIRKACDAATTLVFLFGQRHDCSCRPVCTHFGVMGSQATGYSWPIFVALFFQSQLGHRRVLPRLQSLSAKGSTASSGRAPSEAQPCGAPGGWEMGAGLGWVGFWLGFG